MFIKHFRLSFIILFFWIPSICLCQPFADTLPANKNVILEEFTAVRCSFCPAGNLLRDSILNENPGRAFVIAMHPSNAGLLTTPYNSDPDFRRTFPNAFFSIPFATDSVKFFPGAFINRRQWADGRREQYTQKWRRYTDTILSEPSPVNIGLYTVYDLSNTLYITVELYYTDTLQIPQTLYVFLTEDSLVAEQNNGGVNYIHNHIFRESLTAQWGDTVINNGLPGTLQTLNYSFVNSSMQYEISQCHITAMIRNAANNEIITGNSLICDNIISSLAKAEANAPSVFPNPSRDIFYFRNLNEKACYLMTVYNMAGKLILEKRGAGKNLKSIDLSGQPAGIYFAGIVSEMNNYRICLVKL